MVINLMCGLGNQMFQYAYGRCMEKQGHEVMFNLGWFKNYQKHYGTKREYMLDLFNTKIKKTDKSADQSGTGGVWESAKYADQVPELKEELKLRNPVKGRYETGVHIRRGDLVDSPEVDNLTIDYYYDALDYLGAKNIFIFSDDIKWCRENFKREAEYIEYSDHACFELLRYCENKVISNSTFSWWAAYLGGGNVVAPRKNKYKSDSVHLNVILDKSKWVQL